MNTEVQVITRGMNTEVQVIKRDEHKRCRSSQEG
jgi:hypothetical protein